MPAATYSHFINQNIFYSQRKRKRVAIISKFLTQIFISIKMYWKQTATIRCITLITCIVPHLSIVLVIVSLDLSYESIHYFFYLVILPHTSLREIYTTDIKYEYIDTSAYRILEEWPQCISGTYINVTTHFSFSVQIKAVDE